MDKYQNKYRIPSARATWWNYGWAGAYFITICTKGRKHYFGHIENKKMTLSHCGLLADVFWHEIKNHTTNIELGAFVVMPNHIHGILILNGDNNLVIDNDSAIDPQSESQKRFRNPGKNTASSIIGGYKSAVTKHANRLGLEFGWQTRFHDHIIRNDAEYQRINDYIENNPKNWNDDKFY
ncbi:transposase [Flavobacterium sp. CBA20B-1]|uniref:transposase n=1 Tax=unclassified Flavobacterium TaxID=196869 RepID=UPI00222572D8|nr:MULTISPECIES: transposase [unclassified Flavobacterium]WCM42537.1 transposase [Flavobacterium sp. CBA20B-1]